MAYVEILVPQKFSNPTGLITIPDFSARLVADLDADKNVTTGGGLVTSWKVAEGTLALTSPLAIDTTAPTLAADVVNGRNAVRFNGAQSLGSTTHDQLIADGAPGTIAVVWRDDNAGDFRRRIVVSARSASIYRHLRSNNGIFQALANSGTYQEVSATTQTTGRWVVGVASFTSTQVTLTTSYGDVATGAMTPGDLSGILLGASLTGGDKFSGDIARVMVWDRALAKADTEGLIGYLSEVYGII